MVLLTWVKYAQQEAERIKREKEWTQYQEELKAKNLPSEIEGILSYYKLYGAPGYAYTYQGVESPKVPPPWTHELVIGFLKLPGATPENLETAIQNVLPYVNGVIEPFGYTHVEAVYSWDERWFSIRYSGGSPGIPLAAMAVILFATFVILQIAPIALAWVKKGVLEAQHLIKVDELFEGGKISETQYLEIIKAAKEQGESFPWMEILGGGAIILILLIALMFMGKGRGK